MDDYMENDKLDEYMVDQLRVHQQEIAAIRDELDEGTTTYELLDRSVKAVSKGIDEGTTEWRLTTEDDSNISDSNKTTEE